MLFWGGGIGWREEREEMVIYTVLVLVLKFKYTWFMLVISMESLTLRCYDRV